MSTLEGDGPCDHCATRDNIVWFTDNVFWNAVVRERTDQPEPILCVSCFVALAEQVGFAPTGWRLTPEWPWRDQAPRTDRGTESAADRAARMEAAIAANPDLSRQEIEAIERWESGDRTTVSLDDLAASLGPTDQIGGGPSAEGGKPSGEGEGAGRAANPRDPVNPPPADQTDDSRAGSDV